MVVHDSEGPEVGGDTAILEGRLESHGGCAVVVADTGAVYLPSFPLNWTAGDPETATLSWGGSTSASLGDRLTAGGGYYSLEDQPLPPACEGSDAQDGFLIRPQE